MTAKRLFIGLIICLIMALSGRVWTVLYASGWLKDRSQSLIDKKLEQVLLNEKQQRSYEAITTLDTFSDVRETVEAVAPKEKEQEKIIAELYKIAEENNLRIGSLSFPASKLGVETKKAPAPTTTTDENSEKPATSTPAPAVATAPAKPSITQTEKVDGLTGVVGLTITPSGIVQNGYSAGMSYDTMINFLEALERNRRQMIIDEITIVPSNKIEGQDTVYDLSLSLTALIAQ